MRNKTKAILPLLLMLIAFFFIPSCTSPTALPGSELTEAEVRAIADPMVENMLQAMNTADYAQYTRDFNQDAKERLASSAFETINAMRIETVGNYISKEFWKMAQ